MTKTKPLTTEQQQYVTGLVKQYPNPLGLVCTALIRGARVGKGAVYYAKEFGYDDEDIQQTAWQGAVEAARNFDPTRGADFSTYAAARMISHVQRMTTRFMPGSARQPLYAILSLHDDRDPDYEHEHPDYRRDGNERTDPALKLWCSPDFTAMRQGLDIRWRLVLYLRTVESYSLREVASTLCISKERVRQIQTKAKAKIRERAEA